MVDEVEKKETEETPEEIQEEAITEEPEVSAEVVDAPADEKPKASAKADDTLKKKKVAKIDKVAAFNEKYLRDDIPKFKAGDTIRVHYQIVEGDKTRIQVYEGVCIARKHSCVNETIMVRKMSGQIGVERTFFLHSKRIEKIEVKRIGKVRRAKIYFLRGKVGKKARIREAGLH